MEFHTATKNVDVSLAQEFQNKLSNASHKCGILDHVKHKKCQLKKVDKQGV